MKYVALLSGGKDSCFNLLHCHQNGHELVAAASLGPQPGKEELDSYLYQTVGHDAIHLVAGALQVPLYTRVISGTSVEQGSEYGSRNSIDAGGVQGDETEDMYSLLSKVKSHHPDIEGVSVGAILSNYQRVRVEHVCRRLSLVPLCYLWQRDQSELLAEMIECGMVAVLIKVAGIGLTVDHLGKSLSEMQPTLLKLNKLYGSHVCGEGGEYETLTLDCPLFKSRIELTEVERVIHSPGDFAPVAFLRIKKAVLVPKPESPFTVRVPALLEPEFAKAQEAALRSQEGADHASWNKGIRDFQHVPHIGPSKMASKSFNSWVAVPNVHRKTQGESISIEDEVRECFRILEDKLRVHSLALPHVAHVNIFLASMGDFAQMNAVYAAYFGTSPPARACVALDLPSPIRVKLECIAFAEQTPSDRQALHVQGLSYWAPANIGPYSQAILVGERIFISGQIGLVPSNLMLPSPRSLALEASLSCQHVHRIMDALRSNSGGCWDGHAQLVIYWLTDPKSIKHIKTCDARITDADTPTLFLGIRSLPKDALVEKQVLLHTGRCLTHEVDDPEPTMLTLMPRVEQGNLISADGVAYWEISRFSGITASCAIVCFRGQVDFRTALDHVKEASGFDCFSSETLSIRLFYNVFCSSVPTESFDTSTVPLVNFIPCRFISTREDDDWDFVLCTLII